MSEGGDRSGIISAPSRCERNDVVCDGTSYVGEEPTPPFISYPQDPPPHPIGASASRQSLPPESPCEQPLLTKALFTGARSHPQSSRRVHRLSRSCAAPLLLCSRSPHRPRLPTLRASSPGRLVLCDSPGRPGTICRSRAHWSVTIDSVDESRRPEEQGTAGERVSLISCSPAHLFACSVPPDIHTQLSGSTTPPPQTYPSPPRTPDSTSPRADR